MQGMFGSTVTLPDGKELERFYNGPGQCIFNAEKKCDSCRKCLDVEWQPNA
jgi:hypothetical protein